MVPDDFRPDEVSTVSRELDRRSRQQADVARLGVLALSGVPISDLFGEALRSIRAHLGVAFAGVIRMNGDSAQLAASPRATPGLASTRSKKSTSSSPWPTCSPRRYCARARTTS